MHLSIQQLDRKFGAAIVGLNKVRCENRSTPHHTYTLNHFYYTPGESKGDTRPSRGGDTLAAAAASATTDTKISAL
jgi:hypothetical protein